MVTPLRVEGGGQQHCLLPLKQRERTYYLETEAKLKFLLTYSLDHTKIDPHAMIFTIHHLHFHFKCF